MFEGEKAFGKYLKATETMSPEVITPHTYL